MHKGAVVLLLLLVAVGSAAAARCGAREPTAEEFASLEYRHAVFAAKESAFKDDKRINGVKVITIPTHVHVVMPSAAGLRLVKAASIKQQIEMLNKAYATAARDVRWKFQLVPNGITRTVGHVCSSSDTDAELKAQLHKGDASHLNIYIGDLLCWNSETLDYDTSLGYSTFPWEWKKTAQSALLDGVVVDYRTLPGSSSGGYQSYDKYKLGYTAAHEVGHWMGLYHTFQGDSCSGEGDGVSDTPSAKYSEVGLDTSGECTHVDSCPGSGPDPIENFMSYSADKCLKTFTPGQQLRMQRMWQQYRANKPTAGGQDDGSSSSTSDAISERNTANND